MFEPHKKRDDENHDPVVRWAEKVRANETLLDGLLLKKFDVVVPADDGELIFKNLEENDGEHTTR